MKKVPSEYLNIENIGAFVEENKDKKLFELFEVKEEYDVGDMESRRIEQLEPSVRVYNTFKRFKYNGIGKGFDPNENLLNITVGELETKYRRFIGKRGIVELLEKLNGFLKEEAEITLEISETGNKPRCIVTADGKPEGSIICEPAEINRCYDRLKTLIYETLIGENNGVVGIEYEDIKDALTSTGVYNSFRIENSNAASLDILKTEFEKIKADLEPNEDHTGIITVTGNIDLDAFESICSMYEKTVTDRNLVQLYPTEISKEIIIDVWTMKKR